MICSITEQAEAKATCKYSCADLHERRGIDKETDSRMMDRSMDRLDS